MPQREAGRRRDAELEHYEVLERYEVLHIPAGRDLQALVDLAARICDAPNAAINMISSDLQHQIATTGFAPSVCARDDSMCAAVMTEKQPVVVPDASLDPRFADNPFVTGVIGSVRFYASAPITTPDGVTIGRLCVFDDVPRELTTVQTEALGTLAAKVMDVLELRFRTRALERSMDDLRAARDELRRSNHHLELFASQVSHDLRGPLTAILANTEMLLGEPSVEADDDVRDMVAAIGESGHRMNAMIGEILAFAREGGQIRMTAVALGEIFALVLRDLTPLTEKVGAVVTVDALPTVVGDRDMIYSVALNLVTNAVKFAREEVPSRVHVSGELSEGWCRVRVSDNGVGIPPERAESVFELYARGADDVSARVAGHGIGLATSKRLVQAHGGRVGIEPRDEGTTVWFDLPV
jgi:signal transduction histidine kinase